MSDTKPDLDAIEARAIVAGRLNVDRIGKTQKVRAETAAILAREDVPALVAYARTLEHELRQKSDTLTRRTAAHDRLIVRAEKAEAKAARWKDRAEEAGDGLAEVLSRCTCQPRRSRRVLDGDQQTETP